MTNYVQTIGEKFPTVSVSCVGDPTVYANLVWEGGSPLPSESELQTAWTSIIQEQAWQKIKGERDKRKAAGIKVGENWFHSDDASRIQQIALTMLGASLPAGIMWKTMTGSFVEMTPSLASSIFQMNMHYDKMNFANAETHRQAMLQSADPLAYDYSSGWLQSFEDAHPELTQQQVQAALT